MELYEVIQGSGCCSAEAVPHKPAHSWDLRAAVCAVGSRNIDAHSDEALVFLLLNAVDQPTIDDLFNELFRRYQLRVTRWCYRVTRDPECVPDLVQEVFLRAFRRLMHVPWKFPVFDLAVCDHSEPLSECVEETPYRTDCSR